jgi:hypothetical protein
MPALVAIGILQRNDLIALFMIILGQPIANAMAHIDSSKNRTNSNYTN